ncbi:MAG: tRNA pseudouridine(38-40) synthase TruA [Sphingomicrobium sp.]
MTRWRLAIEYDGGPFMGWQRQANDPSVQGRIEAAIFRMSGERATVHGAGRTDSGVHALAMSAHVDIHKHFTTHRLRDGLNALVRPEPIAILAASEVADDWHARFSCSGRRYEYRILNRRAPASIERRHVWHVPAPLDLEAMAEGAAMLIGTHDFTTFRSAHCQSKSPVKSLDRLDIVRDGEQVRIHAAARSFLHHQVRSMVGCLVMVGRGQWAPADIQAALDARDRAALGLNAPPEGLYFVEALYP